MQFRQTNNQALSGSAKTDFTIASASDGTLPVCETEGRACPMKGALRNNRVAGRMVLHIALAGMAAISTPAIAQNPDLGSAPVTVQKAPPANPVPVAGPPALSNPAVNSAPINAAAAVAVPVRNIDEPGRSPYQSVTSGGATPNFCVADFAPVPANKRLVVEHLSAYAAVSGATTQLVGSFLVPGQLNGPRVFFSAASVGDQQWVANQQMTVYVEPGGVPRVAFTITSNGPTCHAIGTLTGHLIDLTQ